MMVISFQNDIVRNFLIKNGMVYTFRLKRRKQFQDLIDSGYALLRNIKPIHATFSDWANEGRGKPAFAYVFIKELGEYEPKELEPFVKESGFYSLDEWIAVIHNLNKWKPIKSGWLYWVKLQNLVNPDLRKTAEAER